MAIKLIRVAIKLRGVGILKRDIQQKVPEWWWGRGMSGGEGVEEGEGPGREGEGEGERERERDKHFPLCSTQQDRRADWNSEWKVRGGG